MVDRGVNEELLTRLSNAQFDKRRPEMLAAA
jgi:hypothetical protein